jgi:hypothetical protein
LVGLLKGDPVRAYCGCWDPILLLLSRGVFRSREKYGRWRIRADLIAGEEKENVPSYLIASEDAVRTSTGLGKLQESR